MEIAIVSCTALAVLGFVLLAALLGQAMKRQGQVITELVHTITTELCPLIATLRLGAQTERTTFAAMQNLRQFRPVPIVAEPEPVVEAKTGDVLLSGNLGD